MGDEGVRPTVPNASLVIPSSQREGSSRQAARWHQLEVYTGRGAGFTSVMQALVPSSPSARWSVTMTGGPDDDVHEVSISVKDEGGRGRSNLQTSRRIGARLGPGGSVHGRIDDGSMIAVHVILSLLLGEIPAGMGREKTRTAISDANVQAATLAADREAWIVTALNVAGVSYALWSRNVPGGVVAHADLGWAIVEMWATDTLPMGPFHLISEPFEVAEAAS